VKEGDVVGTVFDDVQAYYQRYFVYDMGEWNDEAVNAKI